MLAFNGFTLIENAYMTEFTFAQNRSVTFKPWMRKRCYHKRVNKKLLKKYGGEDKRHFIVTGNNIVAHPNTIKAIANSVEELKC